MNYPRTDKKIPPTPPPRNDMDGDWWDFSTAGGVWKASFRYAHLTTIFPAKIRLSCSSQASFVVPPSGANT